MRFVDQCRIRVIAGDGGNGAVAFRREKYRPFGGPSGGDGGRGGDVSFVAAKGLSTLQDVAYQHTVRAERGEHGMGSDCYGRAGEDKTLRVPLGTEIHDEETGELVGDLVEDGQALVVARGGKGGRGNIHFATSFDRAPRRAEKGEPGETKTLRLELKVMADVGLLGFPNVGKSTFVGAVSAARPRVADYPFTTLVPQLGVVSAYGGARLGGSTFVVADIPGLIPGASSGVGLGIDFLRHVERTRVLLHLVTLDPGEGRDPLSDYRALRAELAAFSPELATRPEVVALSKADLPEVREAFPALERAFARAGVRLRLVSAATRFGLPDLIDVLARRVRGEAEPPVRPPVPEKVDRAPDPKKPARAPAPDARARAERTTARKKVASDPKAPKKVASASKAPNKVASAPKPPKKVAGAPKAPKKIASAPKAPKKVASAPKAPKKVAGAGDPPKRRRAAPKKDTPKTRSPTPKKAATRRGTR